MMVGYRDANHLALRLREQSPRSFKLHFRASCVATPSVATLFQHSDSAAETEKKRAKAQKQLEDKYHEISKKYTLAQEQLRFDPKRFNIYRPDDILTDNEIKFMTAHNPQYFSLVNDNLHSVWKSESDTYELQSKKVEEYAHKIHLLTSEYKSYLAN